MIKCILFLAIAVASTSSQKPCSYPDEWEALFSTTSATAPAQSPPSIDYIYGIYSVDLKNHNKSFTSYKFGDPKMNIDVLDDYSKMIGYTILPYNKTCFQGQLPAEAYSAAKGITDSAFYTGRSYFGLEAFYFDTFYADLGELKQSFAVTLDNCLPFGINSQYSIPDEISIFDNMAYLNSTLKIKDPSVFNLPSYCNSAKKSTLFKAPHGSRRHQLFQ